MRERSRRLSLDALAFWAKIWSTIDASARWPLAITEITLGERGEGRKGRDCWWHALPSLLIDDAGSGEGTSDQLDEGERQPNRPSRGSGWMAWNHCGLLLEVDRQGTCVSDSVVLALKTLAGS